MTPDSNNVNKLDYRASGRDNGEDNGCDPGPVWAVSPVPVVSLMCHTCPAIHHRAPAVILSSQLGQCQLRSKITGDTRDRSDGGWKVGTLCLKPYFDEGMCLLLSYHQKWDSTQREQLTRETSEHSGSELWSDRACFIFYVHV